MKGGQCEICGYNNCNSSLSFHHPDPSKKDSSIKTSGTYNLSKVIEEIEKCHLVCANCHGEIHSGMHPSFVTTDQRSA